MPRLSRFQLGSKLSAREKIEGSGYEALLGPDVTDDSPERAGLFLFELSNDGYNALVQMASLELLEQQRENWIQARRTGNDEPLQDDLLADLYSREAYFEVMKGEKLKLIGTIIYHNLDPETGEPLIPVPDIPVYQIELVEAEDLDYPVPEKVLGKWPVPFHDKSPYLVIHILKPPKGDKGLDGQDGEPGQDGKDGEDGPPGPQGPAGQCEDCNHPIGGQTGPDGNNDGGGSGPGGSANPDGNDKVVYIRGCPDPIINFPYCSDSFSFDHASMKGAILSAAQSTGHFNPLEEDAVSAVLDWNGAAYGGVTVTVDTGEEPYSGSGGDIAGVLTVVDTQDNEMEVPHTTEEFGEEDVLVVQGYHYHGTTGLRMDGEGDVTLTGEMSTYPLLGTANCHNPPDQNDPAWLKVCLRQFVKHPKPSQSGCSPLFGPTSNNPRVYDFRPWGQIGGARPGIWDCWTGLVSRGVNPDYVYPLSHGNMATVGPHFQDGATVKIHVKLEYQLYINPEDAVPSFDFRLDDNVSANYLAIQPLPALVNWGGSAHTPLGNPLGDQSEFNTVEFNVVSSAISLGQSHDYRFALYTLVNGNLTQGYLWVRRIIVTYT